MKLFKKRRNLTVDVLQNALLANFGLSLTPAQLQELFAYIDKDHSGSIDFNEFVKGVAAPDYKQGNVMQWVTDRADKETAELQDRLKPRPRSWRRSRGRSGSSGTTAVR